MIGKHVRVVAPAGCKDRELPPRMDGKEISSRGVQAGRSFVQPWCT